MKNKINRFKELWAVPKYKILIKFLGWFIFFVIFFVMVGVSNLVNQNKSKNSVFNTTSVTNNYTNMKKDLTSNNLNFKYQINDYYLEGEIKNNILTGTLEDNDVTTKIKYDSVNIFTVKKDVESLNSDLLNDINKNYLLPNYIINLLNQNDSLIHKSADEKIYSYVIDNTKISVYVSNEINKIIILENNVTYELNYDILK